MGQPDAAWLKVIYRSIRMASKPKVATRRICTLLTRVSECARP
jgi:hypothetical protein